MSLYEEKRKQERENPNIKYVPVKPVPVEGGGTVCVNVESKSVGGGVAHLDVVADTPDDLGRINDERMAQGLEAIPTKAANEAANGQRDLLPADDSEECTDRLLEALQDRFELKKKLEQAQGWLLEASGIMSAMVAVSDCEDDIDDADSSVTSAIETVNDEIQDLINGNVDELARAIELDTVAQCVDALEMYGSNDAMRQIITCRLQKLTGAR